MAKNVFSTKRLSIKIGLLLIVPLVLMTQLPGPSGAPILNASSLNPTSWIEEQAFFIKRKVNVAYISVKQWLNNEKVTGRATLVVYRSKNKYGNWEYTQSSPAGVDAEQVKITDRSIRLPKPSKKLSTVLAANDKKVKKTSTTEGGSMSFPLAKVQGLIEDSKNVQKTLDDRNAQMGNF